MRFRKPWSIGEPVDPFYPHLPGRLGWQPSRSLSDRAEAERAFALAERLASVNAAAIQLGTTWPSLCKAIARHGLGMPAGNPEAVRQEAIAAAISALVSPPPHAPGGRGVLRVAGGRGPGGCRRRQGGRLHGVPCRAGERREKGCWGRCAPHSGWPERSGPRSGDGKGCGLRPCSNPTVA